MCDDMTAEATIAKLCYLFGKGFSNEQISTLMTLSLRGEISSITEEVKLENIQKDDF